MSEETYYPPPFPWRQPREESTDLYPGLVVCDGRVSGSITLGQTRLPIWAIPVDLVEWAEYVVGDEGVSKHDAEMFIHRVLNQRGEFARLLLILAECERTEKLAAPWWHVKKRRRLVRDQLTRCLNALGVE